MKYLIQSEVVGRRISEVAVTRPDKPVCMSDQSYSRGYVKLENGAVIDLDSPEPVVSSDIQFHELDRDVEHEKTFLPAIGEPVVDLLLCDGFFGVCVLLESGRVIAVVSGQFWIAPFLHKSAEFPLEDSKSAWPSHANS